MRLTIFIALICFIFGVGSHYINWDSFPEMDPKLLSCFVFAILTWIFFGCGILTLHYDDKIRKETNDPILFMMLTIGCMLTAAAFGVTFLFCLHAVVYNILY